MDFNFTPDEEKFRQELRTFLQNEHTTEGAKKEWDSGVGFGPNFWELIRKLGARGWLTPTWPKKYGGLELSNIYKYIAADELNNYTHMYHLIGAVMAGPIILNKGTEAQKEKYLPRIARGEIEFSLGYTEPEAGSDLANLSIRAEDKGDYFIISGQKMFNSRAHFANYHWLGARTQDIQPKHKGISLIIVDLKTPGITIEPIWTIAGGFRTNMIYYDQVKVPKENMVGEKNKGFYYIMEALDHERMYFIGDLKSNLDHMINHVKSTGKASEDTAQKLAELSVEMEILRLFALRVPWMIDEEMVPAYQAAMLKVFFAETEQHVANTSLNLLGKFGMLTEESKLAPMSGEFEHLYMHSLENLITRGSPEIMRNIIALRGLGLPTG
ncbi:MAG TPA: acyl-CoA dehydrogenase family protein [Dehalococcoidales bacterium]|nr:acyl-CoA dehydrogenase family protein [Dehalococcoidales bacterium]